MAQILIAPKRRIKPSARANNGKPLGSHQMSDFLDADDFNKLLLLLVFYHPSPATKTIATHLASDEAEPGRSGSGAYQELQKQLAALFSITK